MTLLSAMYENLGAETPSLVYFERILSETVSYFLDLTSPVPRRRCLYSAKAATFPFLLRALHRHGVVGFDASSATEAVFLARALERRVPLFVTAPALTDADFDRLEQVAPACIHLDSLGAIERALARPRPMRLGIRINPGVGFAQIPLHEAGGPRSRLGLPLAELGEALLLFRRHGRRELGIHVHTTCEAADFNLHTLGVRTIAEAFERERSAAAGLSLTHLDVGGGLRPPRWDFERDVLVPQVDASSCASLVDAIAALVDKVAVSTAFSVLFEPGDLLVCAAAVLVSRVIEERHDPAGNAHLVLDTNINHFPNVLHYGNTPSVVFPLNTGSRKATLSGSSCLGGDHIAELRYDAGPLPERVIFGDRGSYEYTQYNFFNGRFRPNVLLFDQGGELVRQKSDSTADLLAYWREDVAPFPENYQSFHHFESIARVERGMHYDHPDLRRVSSFELDPTDFPAPPGLLDALTNGLVKYGHSYGRSLGLPAAREEVAVFENRLVGSGEPYSPARVACTLGATNAIWLALEAILGGGLRRLLIPCPTYYQFATVAAARGIPWSPIHRPASPTWLGGRLTLDGAELAPSLEAVIEAIDGCVDIGAVALVTPGLPIGNHYDAKAVRCLADKARAERWTLIVDETLRWLDYDGPGLDWSWLEASHPVVRIASISKTFGLPGLRIGTLSATAAATRRPDTGDDIFGRMAALADAAYSAPPAAHVPVLSAGLEILSRFRDGDRSHADVRHYAENLARLKSRAARGAAILSAWLIPHVPPHAGASLVACLPKLSRCRDDAEGFFRALIREQGLFLETGGHFSQNPAWPFTLARLGLGRESAAFEADLLDFCRFYHAYVAPRAVARAASER